MQNDHLSYVAQVPHLQSVLFPLEMTDLLLLAHRSPSLGKLLDTLTAEQSTWLLDAANVIQREGYRKGANAASDSD